MLMNSRSAVIIYVQVANRETDRETDGQTDGQTPGETNPA